MKIAKKFSLRRALRTNRKGVALVTVLTVMSLTTILVLTFFTLASSEHRASKTYSYGLQSQQVAEQAVNMVIAQIREATTVSDNPSNLKVWSSQPGAIRTWNQNGEFDRIFKLYSDDIMKTDNQLGVRADFADIAKWADRPDHFVDLNEPVIRGEKVYYPIVSATASVLPEWPQSGIKDDSGEYDANGVEGFKYDAALVEEGDFGRKAAEIADATDGHVAMPVRWIYQLADGTVGTLEDGGAGSSEYRFVAFSGQGQPSEKNPLVARFAFWADDETTKLNINTHAGGAAWDLPRAGGRLDRDLAQHQPAKNEWQRYPGHPATVHLSPALAPGYLLNPMDNRTREQGRDAMEKLFDVVPRVVPGGSQSGTRKVDKSIPSMANGLIPDTEPLFPSLDDMVMRSDRQPHVYPDNTGTDISESELGDFLERSKFFITAYSRAPEVNLFNLPRVAIWPVYNAERSGEASSDYQRKLTSFDRLIHYCASVGNTAGGERYDYIFKREKADSPTYDYQGIPRNREVYEYLNRLMNQDYPGYGASFASKYSQDQQQILTQIFDYIRSTNIYDDTLYKDRADEAYVINNKNDHLTFTNYRNSRGNQILRGEGLKGHGQVVPIEIDDTKGFGRMYTISSAQVMAICAAQPGFAGEGRFPGIVTEPDENTPIREIEPGNGSYGPVFLNIPPKPSSVLRNEESTWPIWLKDLRQTNPREFEAVWRDYDWNWQLAFLNDDYKSAVLANPTANKFNQSFLNSAGYTAAYKTNPGTPGAVRLADNERMVQAALLFNLFTPSVGWVAINPDMEIDISSNGGMNFTGSDGSYGFLGFEGYGMSSGGTYTWATNWTESVQGARRYGGVLPFQYVLHAPAQVLSKAVSAGGGNNNDKNLSDTWTRGGRGRLTPIDRYYDSLNGGISGNTAWDSLTPDAPKSYTYDLVTVPFKINGNSLNFNGGQVTFEIFPGRDAAEASAPDASPPSSPLQTVELNFDSFNIQAPQFTPQPTTNGTGWRNRVYGPILGRKNRQGRLRRESFGPLERVSITADPGNLRVVTNLHKAGLWQGESDTVSNSAPGRAHGRMAQVSVRRSGGFSSMFGPGDVVQSVEVSHGDARLVAASKNPSEHFEAHRDYGGGISSSDDDPRMSHSLTNSVGNSYWGFRKEDDYLIIPDLPKVRNRGSYAWKAPLPLGGGANGNVKSEDVQRYGDFDSGLGLMTDGPYINKPDEGNISNLMGKVQHELDAYWATLGRELDIPYFTSSWRGEAGGAAYFSPNRIVSGPGVFGSLPTGVKADEPWRTLLFRPNVVSPKYDSHPGAGQREGGSDPPDHALMDLFWMPVVEPYAISEPLSTAGKINMNYQMAPFLHIDRNTALRGIMRSEFMAILPNRFHTDYKHRWGKGHRERGGNFTLELRSLRSVVHETGVFKQFDDRFNNGEDLFKSATEICEIHLPAVEVADLYGLPSRASAQIPTVSAENMGAGRFWDTMSLTSDNSRERPYANLQQRLTTKSNTFKVHFRAQVIKQSRRENDAEYGVWRPELDTVQAEYRGSSIVERFVDPNHPDLPDFATQPNRSLDEFYQYRVVNPRRFAP
tara:strand:- start:15337 stop:20055 length:4719 start_codon:yes stop_codon:yes gene_type:complete